MLYRNAPGVKIWVYECKSYRGTVNTNKMLSPRPKQNIFVQNLPDKTVRSLYCIVYTVPQENPEHDVQYCAVTVYGITLYVRIV